MKLDQLRVDRDADQLRPRKADALSKGGIFAIVAHAGLIVALALGVSWRSSEPEGVEAELWSAVPQIAAAPATPPPEPPKPEPVKPVPEPPVVKPPPAPERAEADIAREKQKREQKEREQREADEKQKKLEAQKKTEEQQKRDEAERKKKEEAEQRKKQEALAAKARQDQLARVMGQAGATGAENSTGTAMQSSGPSASYAGRIKARVKPNVTFTDEVAGNPLASVEVRCAPDGTIVGRRLVRSSGVPAWDDAVLRAIDKTEVLPRDVDGRVPSPMVLDFRPRDF
ncbi:TonB C-terminal domain-containing protein [Caldimonas sp. KR1-144]|uniref:cell envelope integrity protein TolA n=1 Tax=Caldimonas sp. KR1-144 TaxID=3400911 RepID=UPI003C0F63E6